MPTFKYKARNQMGKIVQGTVEVENEGAVAAALRQRRLELVSSSGVSSLSGYMAVLFAKGGKVTSRDIVVFSRQFATMINAGLPILQGLTIVAEQAENPSFRTVMTKIRDEISNGVPLSDAMAK